MRSLLRAVLLGSLLAGGNWGVAVLADDPAWDRTRPDSAIYVPTETSGGDDRCNQQVVGIVTRRGTYLATWTMASQEAKPDQRVVVSRSTDAGRSWSAPAVLDRDAPGNPGAASYGVLFEVPRTGRIYLFYLKNDGRVRLRRDITGFWKWQYSDDDGRTWTAAPGRYNMGKGEWTDPAADAPGDFIGIYSPHATSHGDVLFSFARYGQSPDVKGAAGRVTEVFFLRLDNVLTEPDAAKLAFTLLPEGPRGLRIRRTSPKRPVMYWGNEPSWIELSDGRLVTAIRTRNGAVYYAVSRDWGKTWTQPEPLLYHDGGEPLKNPNSPCPMIRLADGRIVLMFNNQLPSGTFGPRNPVYLVVGRESLGARQPIEFGRPVKFMEVDRPPKLGTTYLQIASYSSLVEHDGQVLLFYNDCKHWVLFKRVPPELLRPRFP